MRQANPPAADVLNSWKEIALYMGRGVRTVQRWERDLRLPVHRPRGKQRSAVLALPEELDAWIQKTPGRGLGELLITSNTLPLKPVQTLIDGLQKINHGTPESRELRQVLAQARELRASSLLLLRQLMEVAREQRQTAVQLVNRMNSLAPRASAPSGTPVRPAATKAAAEGTAR